MNWKNLILGALVLAVLGYQLVQASGTPGFSGEDARRLVQQGARLVDVRTPQEYAAGHIEGAINIPVQELEARVGELMPKDKEVVLYCRSGNRTKTAVRILGAAGFKKVYDLGAMSRW